MIRTEKLEDLENLHSSLYEIKENFEKILEYEDYLGTTLGFLINDLEQAIDDEEEEADVYYTNSYYYEPDTNEEAAGLR